MPTTRLYRCANCQTVVKVGQGRRFVTIEALKESRCPKCSNARFRYCGRPEEPPQKPEPRSGEIRRATPDDLSDIVNFEAEIARISFPEDPITDPEIHKRKLAKALEDDP